MACSLQLCVASFPKISGLSNCGSMPRTCYTGLRVMLCLSVGEKKNGPRSDVLSCLFAAPFGVGERPVLIDSLVFLYLLLLPCSVSFFFSCSLGIFQVRACSHSQAQVTQNINSPSNCMSRGWGGGGGVDSTTRLRQMHLGLESPLWK